MKKLLLAFSILLAASGVAEAQFAGAYGPLVRLPQLTVSSAALQAAANPGTNPPTNFVVVGLTGGAALSGNNTGGTAADITLTGGPGGTSTGSAPNANGQAITLLGGAAGTGGGGAAGNVGRIALQSTVAGAVTVGGTAGGLLCVGVNTCTDSFAGFGAGTGGIAVGSDGIFEPDANLPLGFFSNVAGGSGQTDYVFSPLFSTRTGTDRMVTFFANSGQTTVSMRLLANGEVGFGTTPGSMLDLSVPIAAPAAANPGTAAITEINALGQTGGAALSGNNTGGSGGGYSFVVGATGASTGSAANANGGTVHIETGPAGTGGGGTAGLPGDLQLDTTNGGQVLIGTTASHSVFPATFTQDMTISDTANVSKATSLNALDVDFTGVPTMVTTRGIAVRTTAAASGSTSNVIGISANARQPGSSTQTITLDLGVQSSTQLGGTGLVAGAADFYSDDTGDAATGTSNTNHYGLYLSQPTGGGTVTNNYGVYLASTFNTGGTLNDPFLYNGSTPVLISGTGGLEVGGTANAVAGVVTSTNGNRTIPANLSVFGTCNAAAAGTIAYQNDAASCVTGATAANGGAVFCQIVCNGSNWIQQANAAAGSSSYDWSYVFEANEPLNLWANGTILSMQNHGAGYTSFAGGTSPAYAIVTKAGDGGAGNLVVQICNGNTLGDNVCRTVLYTCTVPCNSVAQAFITCAVTNASTANVATHPVMYEVFSSCSTVNPIVNMSATFSTP